jgi:hypothetical protein
MSQAYGDPTRADDPHALPDVEVFHMSRADMETGTVWETSWESEDEPGSFCDTGWYWWACFPGCIPDGPPMGPFGTEADALEDAQGGN